MEKINEAEIEKWAIRVSKCSTYEEEQNVKIWFIYNHSKLKDDKIVKHWKRIKDRASEIIKERLFGGDL